MMDRTTRPLVIVAAFAGSLAVGLVLMLWALGGLRNVAAPAAIGGPFQLTDQAGQTVTEKNLQGRPTLIFFGFTHCPDVCPTSLFEISEVLRAMVVAAAAVGVALLLGALVLWFHYGTAVFFEMIASGISACF